MLNWINGNMKEDPNLIVERTSRLIHGNVVRALNTFRTDKSLHSSAND